MTTIQDVIRRHVSDEQVKTRIHYSFQRRSLGIMSLSSFVDKYDRDALLEFHNIGVQTADIILEAISKEMV